MDVLDRLLDHDLWATTQLLNLSTSLTDTQLDQDFDIGHRSLRETFVHVIDNIEGWTAVMMGRPDAPQRDDLSMPALADRHARAYESFAAFARLVRDEGRLDETFIDFSEAPMTLGGATLHVILHNEDHRTELLHILARLNINNVPELDHGLWDFVRRGLFEG